MQIVCGAPNARAGIKVVLARPGTVIPASGEALKIGTIRGVESRGMMCSARELLLGEDHDGIIELPPAPRWASPVARAGGRGPAVHRSGDRCFHHAQSRRRAPASMASRATWPRPAWARLRPRRSRRWRANFPRPKKIALDFTPENKDACPIFAGRLIRGVKNGPAPKWVQDRLKAVGMKSISALVDATNLIAQDRGRPLHVFDADKLPGNLHARMAKDHEQVLALDDKTYVLDARPSSSPMTVSRAASPASWAARTPAAL